MFGCAAVVTVPAVVALVAAPDRAPTNVVAVIELLDKLAVRPVLVISATLPVAAFAKIIKLFPVPAATLILSATFAYATFKLLTRVVLVTVNGAVPVATLLVNVLPTTAPAVFKFPALALPVTANDVSVPTLVKLELTTVDFNVVPDKFAALAVIATLAAAVS